MPRAPSSMQATRPRHFPNLSVEGVFLGFVDSGVKVLLRKRTEGPHAGRWSLPVGPVRMDERLEIAGRRLIRLAGLGPGIRLDQLAAFSTPSRVPRVRVVSVAFCGLVPPASASIRTAAQSTGFNWFSVRKLPQLAFDHKLIVSAALSHLREQAARYPIMARLLGCAFTLPHLLEVQGALLGGHPDQRNLRRQVLRSGLIVPRKGMSRRQGRSRPAQIYELAPRWRHSLRQSGPCPPW